MRKIGYLDGLRGLAAFQVVFHHFILTFYPALFIFPGVATHLPGTIEATISASPLNLLWDGNFAVCLFFILSGYVLSHKFFLHGNAEIATAAAVKRYFRLALPAAFSVLLAYVMMKLSLFFNQPAGVAAGSDWLAGVWTFQPRFFDALNQAFLGVFFAGTFSYNAVLWTIALEFAGSFIVFGFLALFGTARNRFSKSASRSFTPCTGGGGIGAVGGGATVFVSLVATVAGAFSISAVAPDKFDSVLTQLRNPP